ncbi:MAG: hypothetical protein V2A79_01680 [Planctomycetota bacterium]
MCPWRITLGSWLVVPGAAGASAKEIGGWTKLPPDPTWIPCFQVVPSGCSCCYQDYIATDCDGIHVPPDPGGLCTWVPEEECLVSRCDVSWPEYYECLDRVTGNSCWPGFNPCETHPHCGECWCDQFFDEPCPCDCGLVVTDACHEAVCLIDACITVPIDCDDDNSCTNDGCDDCDGCWHVPKCWPDSDPCTVDGCDAQTGNCFHTPLPEGACCDALTGKCSMRCAAECVAPLLYYQGDGTTCEPVRACCFNDAGSCVDTSLPCCGAAGGVAFVENMTCSQNACYPQCANCRTLVDQFFECYHGSSEDPCDPRMCIENKINTATCEYLGGVFPSECDTTIVPDQPEILQTVRDLLPDAPDCQASGTDFHLWHRVLWGCGDYCLPFDWRVRCDTTACVGQAQTPQPLERGVKKKCGCY